MKYLVELNGFNEEYKFPQNGEKVLLMGNSLIVHEVNNEGNEAGFGWVWLYNPTNRTYDFKMSILDRRVISGNTEIPYIGFNNKYAYEIIQFKITNENGFKFSWKGLKGFVNGIFSKFRRRSNSS